MSVSHSCKVGRFLVAYPSSYDDDRWPSGSAGGKVIKQNPEHKGKHILFTQHPYGTVDFDRYVKKGLCGTC